MWPGPRKTSKMKSFVGVVKGLQLLTIVQKLSFLNVCGVMGTPHMGAVNYFVG